MGDSVKVTTDNLFTTGNAAKLIGINPRRLIGFIDRGIITPEIQSAGVGRPTKLSLLNIIQARIIAELSDTGISTRLAGEIATEASMVMWKQEKYTYAQPDSCIEIVIDLNLLGKRYFVEIKEHSESIAGVMKKSIKKSPRKDKKTLTHVAV